MEDRRGVEGWRHAVVEVWRGGGMEGWRYGGWRYGGWRHGVGEVCTYGEVKRVEGWRVEVQSISSNSK